MGHVIGDAPRSPKGAHGAGPDTDLLGKFPPALVVLTFVIATLIAASVSYHLVELPGRAWLRKADASIDRLGGKRGLAFIQPLERAVSL